jgi:hypothetical protein
MRVGELVRVIEDPDEPFLDGHRGFIGVVVADHSPMRPHDVGRVVDVLWHDGSIEDMYSIELEVISETR